MQARRSTAAVGAMLLAGGLAACEPQPAPPLFTVTETHWASDAAPGDGVCEATTGVGDCTLQAAVEEANATFGGADVFVPHTGDIYPAVFVAITGQVRISGELPGIETEPSNFSVQTGGSLQITDIDLRAVVVVDGTLRAERSTFGGGTGPAVTVGPAGSVLLINALLTGSSVEVVRNAGMFATLYTTIDPGTAAAIATESTGQTFLGSTAVLGEAGAPAACSGPGAVTSVGYNLVYDGSCGLDGTGDVVAAESDLYPFPGSARLEAVPSGVLGCVETFVLDIRGDTRPMDEDQDGEARCDIGAWEATPNVAT